MEVKDRIKKFRNDKNLSTYELSKITGISQSTISKLENDKRKFDLAILNKIANALQISVDRLTGEAVSTIISERLEEINMSLEEVVSKTTVSLHWIKNIDSFIPGTLGDYEIGYDWITQIAEVIGLPGSKLRAALARQEVPTYDGPQESPIEAFSDYIVRDNNIKKQEYATLSSESTEIAHAYDKSELKAQNMVRMVLDLPLKQETKVIELKPKKETKEHLLVDASHAIEGASEEDKKYDDDIINDPDF